MTMCVCMRTRAVSISIFRTEACLAKLFCVFPDELCVEGASREEVVYRWCVDGV